MATDWLKDCVTGWAHTDGSVCGEYLAPPASAPRGGYWCTTHQMFVRHPGSPAEAPTPDPIMLIMPPRQPWWWCPVWGKTIPGWANCRRLRWHRGVHCGRIWRDA